MLKHLKIKLFSENGMKIVNTLFFITVFLGGSVLTILSYSIWLVFLACSVRCTESKVMRAFYLLVAVCAAAVVVWQAAWLFTGLLRGF
ncbi:hypothetical protein [Eubacterium limosum]|uniref:hypothetical protein n=1 Tax=Eubacterium limosum TaxID=1736 RepID=UPI0037245201